MFKRLLLPLVFLLSILIDKSNAQLVDSTFGSNGYLIYGPAGNSQENEGCGNNTIIQPDGKIVTTISKNDPNTHNDLNIYTYRYNPDGSPDMTFGTNGASGIFVGDQSKNRDLQVEANGKIVIIGETEYCILGVCGAAQFIMMRLNPDGSLDSTFGTQGKLITTDVFDSLGLFAIGEKVFLVSNGKYIIAGKGAEGKPFVARLNNDGSKDLSFGINGVYSDTATYAFLKDIDVDANENVYVTLLNYGAFDTLNISDVVIFKLGNQGHPDLSFGTSGRQKVNISNRDTPTSIAVRSDGKVVIGGYSRPAYSYGFGTLEYGFAIVLNSDGTVSTMFPQNFKQIDIAGDSSTFIYKVKITDDDKMLFSGYSMIKTPTGNYEEKAFIYCLDKNGNPYTPFNTTGMMQFDYGQHSTIGCLAGFYDMDVMPNGDLYATGFRNPIAHNTAQSVFIIKINNSNLTLSSGEIDARPFAAKLFPNTSLNPILQFEVETASSITVKLYSVSGELVQTFIENEFVVPGKYSKELSYPESIADGFYFLSVDCGNGMHSMQKICLIN